MTKATPRSYFDKLSTNGRLRFCHPECTLHPLALSLSKGERWGGNDGEMELRGVEPLTSALRTRRSPN